MAFKNRALAKRTAKKACAWCGWSAGRRFACHVIDEGPEEDWNAFSLCPNCSTVFDEVVRPMLYKALREHGASGLPESWRTDNKMSSKSVGKKKAKKKRARKKGSFSYKDRQHGHL